MIKDVRRLFIGVYKVTLYGYAISFNRHSYNIKWLFKDATPIVN